MLIRNALEPIYNAFCIFPLILLFLQIKFLYFVICVCLFCRFCFSWDLVILWLVDLKSFPYGPLLICLYGTTILNNTIIFRQVKWYFYAFYRKIIVNDLQRLEKWSLLTVNHLSLSISSMHTEGKEYFAAKGNKDNFGKKER